MVENKIDCQAAAWAEKTDGVGLSPAEQAVFEAWLAADKRHMGA